jgi:hypothetical protein
MRRQSIDVAPDAECMKLYVLHTIAFTDKLGLRLSEASGLIGYPSLIHGLNNWRSRHLVDSFILGTYSRYVFIRQPIFLLDAAG